MQLPVQALAEDLDNTTDAQGSPLPFLYTWTGLGPAGLPLAGSALAALYTPAALQFGQLSFPAGSLQVLQSSVPTKVCRKPELTLVVRSGVLSFCSKV